MGLRDRVVMPERLDVLTPADPAALASRRDLKLINRIMGQAILMSRLLRRHATRPPGRILELGAGDGTTSLAMARRLARHWPGVELTLLDRYELVAPATRRGFEALGWRLQTVAADAPDWVEHGSSGPFDAVVTNLFLHHFDHNLPRLLTGIARLAPLFVATEPRRNRAALAGSRLLGLLGVNSVTRHDAPASVRAGFAGRELSEIWPRDGWRLVERRAGPFTHAFAAMREGG